MNNKFWKLTNGVESSGSVLHLDGTIASESWWGDEVTPQLFRDELKTVDGNKLMVIINSGGGDVWAGVAIHDALKEFSGEVTVRVSGLAGSIASVIAMAGDVIEMTPGSTMMIHKASVFAFGNTDDMKKAIEMLETVEEGIIGIYTDRTGLPRDEVVEMVEAETWLSAEKAVDLGFADKVVKPEATDDAEATNSIFSGKFAFSNSATKESVKNYVDKFKAKNETEEEETPEVVPETTPETVPAEDEVVVDKDPEVEVVVEDPAEENKSTEDKEIIVENKKTPTPADIAKDQVIPAPADQAPVNVKPQMKAYLKSPEAMEAFAEVLKNNAGGETADVRNAWKNHLEVTMGVTNPDIFLPDALITKIEDAFQKGGEIWNRVTKTGADVWKSAWDVNEDTEAIAGRGRGYNRSVNATKAEQTLTFEDRILRPQFIYKYITLNKEDIKTQRSTGALVTFVLAELPRRIIREVERAIVLGDGRADDNAYKIKEGDPEGFYPIVADAEDDNFFATLITPVDGQSKAETVARAHDEITAEGTPVLIAKKGYSTSARFEKNNAGDLLFPLGTKATDVFDIDTILEPDWFNDTSAPGIDAVVVVLSAYRVVGDTGIESFTNFLLSTNKQEYLQEIFAGGGLTVGKSAVAIASDES